jgi:HemY protein
MFRTILFLVLVGLAAFAATVLAEQQGDVALVWHGLRYSTSIPKFAFMFGTVLVLAMLLWALVVGVWRLPARMRRRSRERRHARGRHAITHGLIAIGAGHAETALRHAEAARRHAEDDPLTLLLHAQAAQLSGDRGGAQKAFLAMTERADTRLLGLRGLFIEAQRNDDPVAAVAIAEEALKTSRDAVWASHAVLGFRCAAGDWTGALGILERDNAAGAIDRALYQRHRAVLLTARALDTETSDRDASRSDAMEAAKLAPTLVPAAVLATKFLSEQQQIRQAMRIIEGAWRANPHPDLADAYAHVRLGDSAQQRLSRVETLAAKPAGHDEGALAVARAAIEAHEFGKARSALEPLLKAPTQRVAMLMAEIVRGEHGDEGAAREWTLRAVRAAHDPAWTADGYVSDRWRPVSPVSGRLDAFQWVTPVAALASDKGAAIESTPAETPVAQAPRQLRQDNQPLPVAPPSSVAPSSVTASPIEAAATPIASAPSQPAAVPPVFRPRAGLDRSAPRGPVIPPVIPIMRAPDDPGVDDDTPEADRDPHPLNAQEGGWRGFLARWVG